MRATHHPVPVWREQVGSLLRDRKPVVVAEMLVVVLIPALWVLLPLPRTIIPLLLLAWLSLWLRQRGWGEVGLRRPKSWFLTLSLGIAIGGSIDILGYTVINPVLLRLIGEAADPRDFSILRGNLAALLALVAFTWPLAAVVEEMVYRGYVLNRLTDLFGQSQLGWGISLILSAVVFSLAHGQYSPRFIVTSTLMGLVEGGSYLLNRRNLWLPIVIHGVSNTISLTLVFLGTGTG
jgi:membrane protease YdiL (CAAX protease family)